MIDKTESVYLETEILDFKELEKHKEQIIRNEKYIPRYLASFILYDIIDSNSELWDETIKQSKKPKMSYKEAVDEFIGWIKEKQEYKTILDEESINKLHKKMGTIKQIKQ